MPSLAYVAPAVGPHSLQGRLVLLDCASLIHTVSHVKKKKKKGVVVDLKEVVNSVLES